MIWVGVNPFYQFLITEDNEYHTFKSFYFNICFWFNEQIKLKDNTQYDGFYSNCSNIYKIKMKIKVSIDL